MTPWMAGFKSTLKELEDVLDLVFMRFPAYLVVRAAAPFKITPDALTATSFLLTGMAAWCILKGQGGRAALLIWLKIVFDCSDGQMARFTKTATRYGRFYDELADISGQFLLFGAIGGVIMRTDFRWAVFLELAASLVLMGVDITVFQNFRTHYSRLVERRARQHGSARRRLFLPIHGLDALREATVRVIPLPDVCANAEKSGWPADRLEDTKAAFRRRFRPMVYVFSLFAGTSHLFAIAFLALAGRLDLIIPLFIVWYNGILAVAVAVHLVNVADFRRRYMLSRAPWPFSPRKRRLRGQIEPARRARAALAFQKKYDRKGEDLRPFKECKTR